MENHSRTLFSPQRSINLQQLDKSKIPLKDFSMSKRRAPRKKATVPNMYFAPLATFQANEETKKKPPTKSRRSSIYSPKKRQITNANQMKTNMTPSQIMMLSPQQQQKKFTFNNTNYSPPRKKFINVGNSMNKDKTWTSSLVNTGKKAPVIDPGAMSTGYRDIVSPSFSHDSTDKLRFPSAQKTQAQLRLSNRDPRFISSAKKTQKMPLETIMQDLELGGEESPPKMILKESVKFPESAVSDRASPINLMSQSKHFQTEKKVGQSGLSHGNNTPISKHSQRNMLMRRRVQNSLAIPKIDGSSSAVSNYSPMSRRTGLQIEESPVKIYGANISMGCGIIESPERKSDFGGNNLFSIGIDQIDDEFHEAYEELEKLGEGGASVVHKVRCKKTNKYFAAKMMRKRDEEKEATSRAEFTLMKSIQPHVNIAQAESFVTSATWTYLVMEYCPGQLLMDYTRTGLGCDQIKNITQQILRAVNHLHKQQIHHRDIKPENVIIDNDGHVKLIDFNVSKKIVSGEQVLGADFGTKKFSAPELIEGRDFDERIDVWGVGCLVCLMLTGKIPSNGFQNNESMLDLCQTYDTIDISRELNTDADTRRFLNRLLHRDYKCRATAKQALQDPWLNGESQESQQGLG